MKESGKGFWRHARQVVSVTAVLLLLCGLVFPLVLTGLSSLFFPKQAEGSLIEAEGKIVGAEQVGQEFTEDYYLWSRPSAYHYNVYREEDGGQYYNDGTEFSGLGSGSSNYAPSNPELQERVDQDIERFLEKNPEISREDIPADLVTASGSGLDPDISPEAAKIQIPRIAEASGLSREEVEQIVEHNTEGKLFGIFGEETVHVLQTNLEIAEAMGILGEAS